MVIFQLSHLQPRIDVAGIGFNWQRREPARDVLCALPLGMDEGVALAQGCVVAGITERRTALDCGRRHVALDGGELERERGDRPRESGQGLRLETLDIDFDEAWRAMAR